MRRPIWKVLLSVLLAAALFTSALAATLNFDRNNDGKTDIRDLKQGEVPALLHFHLKIRELHRPSSLYYSMRRHRATLSISRFFAVCKSFGRNTQKRNAVQ